MAPSEGQAMQRQAEQKRRRRELLAVAITAIVLIAFVLAQTELPPLSGHTSLLSNLVVILLFDLSFLLAGLLLFLVGRNVAKVIFEHRRGLIGSKLQVRLVAGFIAVAIVPSLFLLYVSGVFLEAGVKSWFNPEYERLLKDAVQFEKTYYLNSANNAAHFTRVLAREVAEKGLLAPGARQKLNDLIVTRQQQYNLGTIEVFSTERHLLLLALSPKTPTGIGVSPDSDLLRDTLKGKAAPRTDRLGKGDVIRGSAPIFASLDSDRVLGAIVVDYYVPASLAHEAESISRGAGDYFQLRILRQPIINSYILALVLIGLVVVMLASWFGMYLARGITGPIRLLAEGTHAVAGGNLDHRIPPVGDNEIGHLVRSFNQMTADLRASRAELERRRRDIETLLRNVSAGVAGLDTDGRITAINPCAERLLGLGAPTVLGRHYREAFAPALASVLDETLGAGLHREEAPVAVRLEVAGAQNELMMTASSLGDDENGPAGTVLFFEDVSQIAKVERMEAWREVARRIAHEIKNPLTPIQLSAERLGRNLATLSEGDAALVQECTRTIVSEVQDLKRLVNEFSSFARMPHLTLLPGDLNALAEETVSNFRKAYPDVDFPLKLAPEMPLIAIDRNALKRALVNLLDNAVTASVAAKQNGGRGQVEVTTTHDSAAKTVTLQVADNGGGIEPRLRTRIFEPYFSTKKGGTGLGLAIVSAIVTDHYGFVRVRDNPPQGSRFIIEFHIKPRPTAKASARDLA